MGGDNDASDPQRQLTWSDFNALAERIDVLEQQRDPPESAEERVELLDDEKKDPPGIEDGAAGGSPQAAPTADNPDQENSETNEYQLSESTYTFLMTEKVLSIPFFVGISAVGLCLTSLGLALQDEQDKAEHPKNWVSFTPL